MHLVSASHLKEICQSILLAVNTPASVAEGMADNLVNANIQAVDSHGCRLLPGYIEGIASGLIVPAAEAEIVTQKGAITIMDGHWGFGQLAAARAARYAVESAREQGIGAAAVFHVYHIGRVGEFVEYIARQNMIGMAICNVQPNTTPFGGRARRFGTNPLAMAVPRRDGKILVSDFATSAKSGNKIVLTRQKGEQLAEGIILDKDGNPTTDVQDFLDGGAILPFGGYKGFAINMMIEIVAGLLVGAGSGAIKQPWRDSGSLIVALDIATFGSVADFEADVDALLDVTKATPTAPGVAEIMLPGEIESRETARRRIAGIPVDDDTWGQLCEKGLKLGLPPALFAV